MKTEVFDRAIFQVIVRKARYLATPEPIYCRISNGTSFATTDKKDAVKAQWNYHWATIITSLGTKQNPSKVLIELFHSGRFMESKVGKIELILLDYVDKKRHTFWKKIERESNFFQSDLTPELKLTLVFDVDMTTKLNVHRNLRITTEQVDYFIYPLKNKKMNA